MKKFKKLTSALLALATAAAMILPLGANASANGTNYKWTIDHSSPDPDNRMGWKWGNSSRFSVDTEVHTENSRFSIKIENNDFDHTYVERTYKVEPKTTYKFSAMAKYSGYQLSPDAQVKKSGASIGKPYTYNGSAWVNYQSTSDATTSGEWTKLEYEFTTGANETTHNLCLENGYFDGNCKGTAWFSDVKLEKAETTNNWNILAVIVKNVDATVELNGKTAHVIDSLTQVNMKDIQEYAIGKTKKSLEDLSGGRIKVNSVDTYVENITLTEKELALTSYGYMADKTSEKIVNMLNKYLAQKHYEQILLFSPLNELADGWWGITGGKFKGIYDVHFSQFLPSFDGSYEWSYNVNENNAAVVVHEISHCLENDSNALIGKENSPDLHEVDAAFNAAYPQNAKQGYEAPALRGFMSGNTLVGKKLDPSVFYRPNGKYTLIDNSMETGVGVTPGSGSVPVLAKPRNIGLATIDQNYVKIDWNTPSGADGCQVSFFDYSDYENAWVTRDYTTGGHSVSFGQFTPGQTVYLGLRAKYTQNGKTVYSDWTYLTYTLEGSAISGDLNNDGYFDVNDVIEFIQMILNNSPSDKAYEAVGEKKGTVLTVNHAMLLLQKCLGF